MIRSIVVLVALFLLIPVFAFGDCTRRVAVKQKVVVVERVVVQRVYDNHYYSLDPYYQQQALAAQIVKQLRAELKVQTPKAKSEGPGPGPGPAPEQEPLEPVAGKYQNEKLLAIVNDSCAKCHGASSKQTRLVTKDGKSLADVRSGKVWESFGLVNSGEMPKAADNLGDEAVKLFYEWAKNARK